MNKLHADRSMDGWMDGWRMMQGPYRVFTTSTGEPNIVAAKPADKPDAICVTISSLKYGVDNKNVLV